MDRVILPKSSSRQLYYVMKKADLSIGIMLFFLCVMNNTAAYEHTIRTDTLELRHGLSQNTITTIIQDPKGFMWFGTQDGLNRYDGYTFKVYKPDQNIPGTISNNSIWALFIDRQQSLWVGTYIGLNKYDSKAEQFIAYLHDPQNPKSLSNNNVKSILEDSKGNFWIGTYGGGLNKFDPQADTFIYYVHNPDIPNSISSNIITVLYEDNEGVLWIGTHQGVNRFNPETQQFLHISNSSSNMGNVTVTALHEDQDGLLWIGTDGDGLFSYDKKLNKTTHYRNQPEAAGSLSGNKVTSIYKDSRGKLLIGTLYNGLNRFDKDNNRFIHYIDINEDESTYGGNTGVYSIYEDTANVLWLGTYTNGLRKLNPYDFSQSLVRNKVTEKSPYTQNDARAFLKDRDNVLWVGSESSGIRKTFPDGNEDFHFHDEMDAHSLATNSVFSIIQDQSGIIWIGTTEGWLHKYNPQTNNFTRYSTQTETDLRHDRIRSIMEDHNGTLWIGVDGGGIHTFNRQTGTFTHLHNNPSNANSLSHNRVFSIFEDRLYNIWIATFGGGLNKFDPSTETFTHFKHKEDAINSISYDYIICITQDEKQDVLWLGTDGEGFEHLDIKNEIFTHYGEETGLPNNTIYGILQDNSGDLWMSHNKGLSHFDPQNGKIRNYDERDGLQSNEFNGGAYYKAVNGKFYFGGIRGYNSFYPHEISENPHIPPVVITDFQLFSKTVEIGKRYDNRLLLPRSISELDEITLSYKDYVFSFEFAALDYVLPSKNQYVYKMEGLEDHWNHVGNRHFVTYTTLPPGKYRFQVKASNNHGVMNEKGTMLTIHITPPFWQTWWFRSVIGIILILLIFTTYALRVKSMQARNRMLEQEVKNRTIELEKQKDHLENTLTELQETKDALVEAAHKAGMADSATHVLHNVGNLLNSVTTSVGLIRNALIQSASLNFFKANALLRTHLNNLEEFILRNPKGKKLMNYYLEIEKPLQEENAELLKNTERLSDRVYAIVDVITTQQTYIKDQRFSENLSTQKIIEECVTKLKTQISRSGITIKLFFEEKIDEIQAQKGKLEKILINLLKNAEESITKFNGPDKIIKIKTDKDANSVYIRVYDTGLGIEKDKLSSIFACGYSKKGNGHGYSLHNSANFMTEMNGKMWAESDGIGHGACFTLKFPLKPDKPA